MFTLSLPAFDPAKFPYSDRNRIIDEVVLKFKIAKFPSALSLLKQIGFAQGKQFCVWLCGETGFCFSFIRA